MQSIDRPAALLASSVRWLRRRACLVPLLIPLLTLGLVSPAYGIDITLKKKTVSHPSYDPDGSKLLDITRAAADHWESLFTNASGNYTFQITWDGSLDSSGSGGFTLGETQPRLGPRRIKLNTDVTAGTSVSTNNGWYIDSSPNLNEEYDFTSGSAAGAYPAGTLYEDLSSGDQSDWFGGSPPDLLEVGYEGDAVSSMPDTVRKGYDLYSTVIHEIGHALGVGLGVDGTEYEPYQSQVGAHNMTIKPGDNHIKPRSSLMCKGCAATGVRRMPSAVDALAVAKDEGYSDGLDLNRKYFVGDGMGATTEGQNWQRGLRWIGGEKPEKNDDTYIISPKSRLNDDDRNVNVSLSTSSNSGDGHTRNLYMGNDVHLHVGGRTLNARENIKVGVGPSPSGADDASLNVDGGTVKADTIRTTQTGNLDMLNDATVRARSFLINRGRVGREGTVEFASQFINYGTLRASSGTLRLTATSSGGTVDLVSGEVLAVGSADTVIIDAPVTDPFNGEVDTGLGGTVRFNEGWTLGENGLLELQGALEGSDSEIRGEMQVFGVGRMETTTRFTDTSSVRLNVAAEAAELRLNDAVTYAGTSITGDATVEQNADATVTKDTTIDVKTYDWDGLGGSTTTVKPDTSLTLKVDSIDTTGDQFDGTINLAGVTDVDLFDWRMDGTLNLEAGRLKGENAQIEGTVNVATRDGDFNSYIDSPVEFKNGAQVNVPSGAVLNLEGNTAFDGATFTGDGFVIQNGRLNVGADTTVDVAAFDWEGITNVRSGATLTIKGAVDAALFSTPTYESSVFIRSGAVKVTHFWRMDGDMSLEQSDTARAEVRGGEMRVMGSLTSFAGDTGVTAPLELVDSGSLTVNENATLALEGETTYAGGTVEGQGTLVQSGNADVSDDTRIELDTYDWDGASNAAVTTVESGNTLTIDARRIDTPGTSTGSFNGTATVKGTLDVQPYDLELVFRNGRFVSEEVASSWAMDGTVDLKGGTLKGHRMEMGGTLKATQGVSHLATNEARFKQSGSLAVPGDSDELVLADDVTVEAGFSASGTGTVRVKGGDSTLTLRDGASLNGPSVVNENGTLEIGRSLGQAEIALLEQEQAGTLAMDLAGTTAGSGHDQLAAFGFTTGGTLSVALQNGFAPAAGQEFNLIDGFISERFDQLALPDLTGQLTWKTGELYDNGLLSVIDVLIGDMNNDGTVNNLDINPFVSALTDRQQFIEQFGFLPGQVGDINDDGQFNNLDINPFVNMLTGTSSLDTVPEPASMTLLVVTAVAMYTGSRRHTRRRRPSRS